MNATKLFSIYTVLLFTVGCSGIFNFTTGRSSMMTFVESTERAPYQLAKASFVYEDFGHLSFGTLSTNALPWKLTSATLAMAENDTTGDEINASMLRRIYEKFGFIYPTKIANWCSGPIDDSKPIGIISGLIKRKFPKLEIEVANLACASCHAGRLADANGNPTDEVWLGLPNSSLNLDAYAQAIYTSLVSARDQENRIIRVIKEIFPDVSDSEIKTIRNYLLPAIRKRLQAISNGNGEALPYNNGGPGTTNGLAALKVRLNLADPYRKLEDPAYISIPQLADIPLRSSLLSDGVYYKPGGTQFEERHDSDISSSNNQALARIISFFTTPALGGSPASAVKAMPQMIKTFQFLENYEPPIFPGTIDYEMAKEGKIVFDQRCAECHGSYSSSFLIGSSLTTFPNFPVPLNEILTDPNRALLFDDRLIEAISSSPVGKYIKAKFSSAYVAPSLTGIWASSPYLHNGSVPTLWHLMNPHERPQRFAVGAHRLDFELMGIEGERKANGDYVYLKNDQNSLKSYLYDTSLPGKSNIGHEFPFSQMTSGEKTVLLEYLKTL